MQKNDSDTLVIPDIHQHIAWSDAIIERERKQVRHIVFLGDYFDAKLPEAASPAETARFIASLPDSYPEIAFTFLVGNHDLPYLFDLRHPKETYNPYSNNSYNPIISTEIARHLTTAFRSSFQPFALSNGRLLSHAGLHASFEIPDSEAQIDRLHSTLSEELAAMPYDASPLLSAVGVARGGRAEFGGLAWQDWHTEFEDSLAWPQLVGHTILLEPEQKGRSWNLDTREGHYAILSGPNSEIKSLPKS